MDQATPPWRAFSSPEAQPNPPAKPARRRLPRWLAPVLAALGGLAAGAMLTMLSVLVVGVMPAGPATSGISEWAAPEAAFPFPAAAGSGTGLAPADRTPAAELVVDVAGAVVDPGLHRLRAGDRVGDAITAAGGFAPRADLAAASDSLNLARPLEDGAKVLVPELGLDRPTRAAETDGRIDLNRADRTELESLPGIGPVTAGKIIAAREAARFEGVRDLRERGLVGDKVYEDIQSLVRAG